ncbi:hypothetical protein AUR64_11550 [Haloprofundus marisrubri]|uniref:Uncharacterized protein n=1 Tax=Haloprofundus marisrubri TaxID=1514971 RepID=A0A0W1RAX0_9EURY|nr:hypothetical protein [Haloprofundus marisrubri]KTG10213.1 hypothetical protein AUR64_11550 [Haloprofundus marisrubri]
MNPFTAIFERFTDGGGESGVGPFECRGCGQAYPVEYHVCPTCGGYSVESEYDPVTSYKDETTG